MGLFVRTMLAGALSLVVAMVALLGVDWVLSSDEGGALAQSRASSATAGSGLDAPEALSRFDRFIAPDGGENRASAANAACGFANSLIPGGTLIRIAGSPEASVGVYRADQGDSGALRSFTASATAVHAFADLGSLHIQAGHTDRDGFNSRVFVLDEEGFPTFSDPLLARGSIALECENAQAAADILNAEFVRSGGDADPVRAGVRAFEIGDGVPAWEYPRVDAFVSACTPEQTLAELPAAEPFVLNAEYDASARYGEYIMHDMSGESLAGTLEPMVYVTIAEIDEGAGFATLNDYRIPLNWSFLPVDEESVSPVFRFSAIEVTSFSIGPNGARGHSEGGDGVESVRIPCTDPAAGAAALEALSQAQN